MPKCFLNRFVLKKTLISTYVHLCVHVCMGAQGLGRAFDILEVKLQITVSY